MPSIAVLLDILNELMNLLNGDPDPDHVTHIFHRLCDYAVTHFSTEQRYMLAANYPKLPQHRQEHEAFVARVLELGQNFDPGHPKVVEETLNFVKEWYLDHIIKSDQDYAPFLKLALPTSSIEAVIFGLDGVVCNWDPAPLVQLIAEHCGKPEAEVRAGLIESPGLLRSLESGGWTPERFLSELTAWGGASIPQADLAHAYEACFHPVPAMLSLVKRMKAHQPVALAGNAAPYLRSRGLAHLGMADLFTAEVLSCDLGARLPDKALLTKAASALGRPSAASSPG
jgi:hemerythrin